MMACQAGPILERPWSNELEPNNHVLLEETFQMRD